MPWRETRSGTLLRHMSAYQTRSLSVGRTMQLAMLMLALASQARLSSNSRQAPKLWTSATLTSNACDTVGWRTPSPNRGCAATEPTSAQAGVETHLSRREREQPSWPLQSSQLARYLSCPHRKDRDANPGARECPHVLRSWCYIPCSCHRTGTKYDSRPRPELPVAQPSPKQQLDLHAMD